MKKLFNLIKKWLGLSKSAAPRIQSEDKKEKVAPISEKRTVQAKSLKQRDRGMACGSSCIHGNRLTRASRRTTGSVK